MATNKVEEMKAMSGGNRVKAVGLVMAAVFLGFLTQVCEAKPAVEFDPDTKVYLEALWLRVHAEDCPRNLLKDKKKTITLEEADKAGYRIGESTFSIRRRSYCCLIGYQRKYPEKTISDDAIIAGNDSKRNWKHLPGCHRYQPDSSHMRRPMKEWVADGYDVCPHCIHRGPSEATITDEEWSKLDTAEPFVVPAGQKPKPFPLDKLPPKEEVDILIEQTLGMRSDILELQFTDPVASAEHFTTMRFFFPVRNWLTFYQAYRATGDKRLLDKLLESARHYQKLSVEYPSAAQFKASDPEGLAYMYSMAVYARITLQLARKYPDQVSQKEIGEAEAFLKAIVSVLKPIYEGNENLDPKMGIPQKLADDFRSRPFNRAANGIGTIATTAAALGDLQAVKKTQEYQSTIDRYSKVVTEWVKNWKSVGCLFTEPDGKKYFYYPYSPRDKGKMVDGFKLFRAPDDVGHFSHTMQGVMLVHEATPELGVDDDFMTAIANAVYHNSQTKNGSIQCPSADKKRPRSRKPHNNAAKDRLYMFEAFRDGVIDGQCSNLSKAQKEAALSRYSHRLKTLHAQYMKALRNDRSLIHLGEKK